MLYQATFGSLGISWFLLGRSLQCYEMHPRVLGVEALRSIINLGRAASTVTGVSDIAGEAQCYATCTSPLYYLVGCLQELHQFKYRGASGRGRVQGYSACLDTGYHWLSTLCKLS